MNNNISEEELRAVHDEIEQDKRDIEKTNNKMIELEDDGRKNTLKYFDRIHDKLSMYNNILIAGYFALIGMYNSVSSLIIIIPILNLFLLFYVDYRLMKCNIFQSDIRKKTVGEIKKWDSKIKITTFYSLVTMIFTFLVSGVFVLYLIYLNA